MVSPTAAPCSVEHPGKPQVHCNRALIRPHEKHSAYCWDEGRYVSWDNDGYQPNEIQQKAQQKRTDDAKQSENRRTLRAIAAKIRRSS